MTLCPKNTSTQGLTIAQICKSVTETTNPTKTIETEDPTQENHQGDALGQDHAINRTDRIAATTEMSITVTIITAGTDSTLRILLICICGQSGTSVSNVVLLRLIWLLIVSRRSQGRLHNHLVLVVAYNIALMGSLFDHDVVLAASAWHMKATECMLELPLPPLHQEHPSCENDDK